MADDLRQAAMRELAKRELERRREHALAEAGYAQSVDMGRQGQAKGGSGSTRPAPILNFDTPVSASQPIANAAGRNSAPVLNFDDIPANNQQQHNWWENDEVVQGYPSQRQSGGNFWENDEVVEPGTPSYGGAAMNTTAGINEALYGIAGAPVDLMRGAMNLGVRGLNAATGSDVGMIPENSFGGSRWIGETLGGIAPQLDPQNTIAATAGERIARGAGQGIGGTVGPAGLVGGLSRAGMLSPALAETGASIFGSTGSVGRVAGEAVAGAGAGLGMASASESASDEYKPLAEFAGSLVGGFGGALASGLPRGVANAVSGARRLADPLTEGGRERMAGQRLQAGASNPDRALEALNGGAPRQIVEGSQPTTGQMTGDMGLLGMERGAQTNYPERFQQRRADQNASRREALDAIQPTGAPEQVANALRSRLGQIDEETDMAFQKATERARTGASGLGPGMTPEASGESLRGLLESARGQAKQRERELWSAVDPNGTLALSAGNAQQAARRIVQEQPQSARPIGAEEASIYGVLGQYGEVVPFGEITALSSRVKAEMRAERFANGESPAYRRLSQLNGALQQDLETAVAGKVQQEAQAVARGEMSVEDTLLASLQRETETWRAGRQSQVVGGDGPTSFAGYPGGGTQGIPGAYRTEGQANGRPADAQGRQGISADQSNFDEAALGRLTAARDATRQRVETFDNPTLGPISRRPATTSPYTMPSSVVPERIFFSGPKSFDAINSFRRAVGDQQAGDALTGYAVDRLRRVALREDGTLDPGRLQSWRRSHADALRAFPELDARLADAGKASEALAEVAGSRRTALDAAQKGAVGKLIGVEDPSDVTRIIGGLFSRQDAVNQLSRLRGTVRGDKEAEEGLRKAVVDHVMDRFVGNTEAATSGQTLLKSDSFQTFVKRNGPALHAAGFDNDAIRTMEKVAEDLQRSNRSLNAVRIPGQSNTAQDLAASGGADSHASMLMRIALAAGSAGGGVGMLSSPIAGAAATLGTALVGALRENGIRTVDEMVADALLNPERARILMTRVGSPNSREALELAKRYRATLPATAGMAAQEYREEQRQPAPTPHPAPMRPQAYFEPQATKEQWLSRILLGQSGPASGIGQLSLFAGAGDNRRNLLARQLMSA